MIDKQHALIISILHQPGGKGKETKPAEKIGREAFIYLEGKVDDYAQCSSCWQFSPEKERCAILGPDFHVDADATCCFYVHDKPDSNLPIAARVTPKEAGYIDRPVRCENCYYSTGSGKCKLYQILNKILPNIFDLKEDITPLSCCNAQTKK